MQIAIAGLSNSGKTTVFNSLTGMGVETTAYPSLGGEPHRGVVKVPDDRLETLSGIFKPKKTTPSTVEYIDFIGLTKGDLKQNKKVFEFLKDADAIVHVARAFEDASVPHPLEGLDPVRDVSIVEMEMMLADLELVERRLESIGLSRKKGKKPDEAEERVLLKCKDSLEKERPLREAEFTEDEFKSIRHLQFVSIKPEVIVINIGEGELGGSRAEEIRGGVVNYLGEGSSSNVLLLCGKIEMDIAQMIPEESKAFLDDLGIDEPAMKKLIRISFGLLGLISFFTVGEDEVKAWQIKKGSDALASAGKIHSDIQRGFIRAEVVSYDDFIAHGGMSAARDKGALRLEGKTYLVKDGDIINFRFNI